MYYDEISYISERIGIDLYETLLLQLVYETTSACTTAILDVNDNKFYLRTMDWPMDFLRDITIGLRIIKNSEIIGHVVTWLGYVGFLTVKNIQHEYSIAINYRTTGNMTLFLAIKNAYRAATLKWPIGYLVRYILEKNLTLSKAKTYFINVELISPCYITLFSSNDSSYVITRNCDKSINVRSTNLIQTNCDYNKNEPNILWSIERREYIQKVINKINNSEKKISYKKLIKAISKFPVVNKDTIYIHFQYNGVEETFICQN
ncbi:Ntn (N-terminal nucleophile) hydrolase [Acanthamoeba polyphaga moumouvirus]|uniref:Ntn (N-terminal nucleophile) hydrolase n=1 Tax=Acanthamoeba polyphaga moumouvirus TaxID=1269028 RepID=L7RD48_9VIRU|nr:Ntn (N-terminal nucleophile) hydrolase [Acanthamoeba polyphaga moumouvirus]AGC02196.1 Ntn (N-terminal nucleophile) hydrolase [Acanthamoeba polyphaga moumouvirus]